MERRIKEISVLSPYKKTQASIVLSPWSVPHRRTPARRTWTFPRLASAAVAGTPRKTSSRSIALFTRSRGSGTSKSSSSGHPGSRRGEAELSFPSNSDRYSNDRDCPNQITRVGLRALSEPEVFILCVRTRGGGRTATGHAKS